MATSAIYGNAGFRYGVGPTTHQLAAPLRELRPIKVRRRFRRWSLDYTAVNTIVIGAGVDDLAGVIRYENQPDLLRTMLAAGMDGTQLDYYPNLSLGTFYPFTLVDAGGGSADEIELRPDRDRFALGEYEVSVRLRRVDGGSVGGLL